MNIDILKMIYHMLRDLGEDSGAMAIAQAIFEMTAEEEGEEGAWHIYAPPKKRKEKDLLAPGLRMVDECRSEEAVRRLN